MNENLDKAREELEAGNPGVSRAYSQMEIAHSLAVIVGRVNQFESDSYPTSGEIKDALAEVLPDSLFVSDTHRETTAGYLMGELLRRFVIKRKAE